LTVDEVLLELTDPFDIDRDKGYDLPVKHLVLGWTAEYVNLPVDARVAARVEGKSSLARLGLGVHVTAPIIHGGFDGQIRLGLINNGHFPITLKPGMRICQLILNRAFVRVIGVTKVNFLGRNRVESAVARMSRRRRRRRRRTAICGVSRISRPAGGKRPANAHAGYNYLLVTCREQLPVTTSS
jgi:hypothetical protein